MSLQFSLEQINELIRRDYRVPRFATITLETDPMFMTEHISMKDLLMPLLKDYEITKKREVYLIEIVKYLTGHGSLFTYWDNPTKQEFMDSLSQAIPDVKWAVYYERKPKESEK